MRGELRDILIHLLFFGIRTVMGSTCPIHSFVLLAWSLEENSFEKYAVWSFVSLPCPPPTPSQPSVLQLDLIRWSPSFPLSSCAAILAQILITSDFPAWKCSQAHLICCCQIHLTNKLPLKFNILHGMYVCMCVCMCVYIFLILRLAVDMLHSLTQLLPCRSSRYYSFIHHLCSSKLYTKLTLERSPKGNRGKSPVLRVTLSWVQVLTPLLTEYTLHGPFF